MHVSSLFDLFPRKREKIPRPSERSLKNRQREDGYFYSAVLVEPSQIVRPVKGLTAVATVAIVTGMQLRDRE